MKKKTVGRVRTELQGIKCEVKVQWEGMGDGSTCSGRVVVGCWLGVVVVVEVDGIVVVVAVVVEDRAASGDGGGRRGVDGDVIYVNWRGGGGGRGG